MPYYIGVRNIKTDRDTRWEARVGRGVTSRLLGFFDSAEEAARVYNKHAAPLGLELNTDIDPVFRRIRAIDGELTLLCKCGTCGKDNRMPKIGPMICCGRTYQRPDDVDNLPIERSEAQAKKLRKMRRQLDHIMREEQQDKLSRKTLFADAAR